MYKMERFEFYERAKSAYAIVATGESAQYANIILLKGVVVDKEKNEDWKICQNDFYFLKHYIYIPNVIFGLKNIDALYIFINSGAKP